MPNGYEHRKYGKHEYPDHGSGRSDCSFGCGCWASDSRSDGPLGLDPFGLCPNNPLDGKPLRPTTDYEDVVTQRIADLVSRLARAEQSLKEVEPGKLELARKLRKAEDIIAKFKNAFKDLHAVLIQHEDK